MRTESPQEAMNTSHPEQDDKKPEDLLEETQKEALQAQYYQQELLVIEFDRQRPQAKKAGDTEQQAENAPKKSEDKEQPQSNGVKLDYAFERFNVNSEYIEVKKRFSLKFLNKNEMVFEHKNDHSRITIKEDKIICDNTERNIKAVLDIAQDKGWDIIKITGGNKAARAQLWFEANMRGLETQGYEPTEADKKRLLGAQERERKAQEALKSQNLAEALDIKPKALEPEKKVVGQQTEPIQKPETLKSTEAEPKPIKQAETKQKAAEAQTIEAAPSAKKTRTKKAKATTSKQEAAKPGEEKPLSETERFHKVKKEIMAEVEKFFSVNEKEYTHIENTVDEQLALLMKKGGTKNVQKFKEKLFEGLPMLRQQLSQSANIEQNQKAEKANTQEKKTRSRRKTETTQTPKEPKKEAKTKRRTKTELER